MTRVYSAGPAISTDWQADHVPGCNLPSAALATCRQPGIHEHWGASLLPTLMSCSASSSSGVASGRWDTLSLMRPTTLLNTKLSSVCSWLRRTAQMPYTSSCAFSRLPKICRQGHGLCTLHLPERLCRRPCACEASCPAPPDGAEHRVTAELQDAALHPCAHSALTKGGGTGVGNDGQDDMQPKTVTARIHAKALLAARGV